MNKNHKSFLVSLDYGNRKSERKFVSSILDKFDKNTLIGAVLFVNNNIYNLRSYLYLNFSKNSDEFETWLKTNHPDKRKTYNIFMPDIITSMKSRGFNAMGLLDSSLLEYQMTSGTNELFLFADKEIVDSVFPPMNNIPNFTVFLSHSSVDKPIIENVFSELQKSSISAWFDRYEIKPGDSITDKINEGLNKSNIGLLFLSKNFLYSNSGWTINEANYFFQKRMRDKTSKFIVVNIDLTHDELPPLLQDYLYIKYDSPNAIEQIIQSVQDASKL